MLKKFLACTVCLAALAAPAVADPGNQGAWYLRADLGIGLSGFAVWEDELAFSGGAGIGYNYNEMFRTDITFDGAFDYEGRFRGINASLDTYSVMVNGYMDVPLGSAITPYLGAGVGYGWAEASAVGVTADEDGVAIAGMAGVSFDMTQTMALDVGYKYRRLIVDGEDVDDHLIRAGLRLYVN